jgi:hypothetical protein
MTNSSALRRAQRVAVDGFGGADHQLVGGGAESLADGLGLGQVARSRTGAVGVDVTDLRGVQAGVTQRHAHRAGLAIRVRAW